MKESRLLFASLLVLGLAACSGGGDSQEIVVFAASSLTESFGELEQAFEDMHPEIDVVLNLASSATLRAQIEQGAEADIYASANHAHMQAMVAAGLVDGGDVWVFAGNELVVIVPQGNPAGIESAEDLAGLGVSLVIALPDAPAGSYARQALEELDSLYGEGYSDAALGNVVSSEQNVRQVLVKIELGEADAGIVYHTDEFASDQVESIRLPEGYGPRAEYPMAVLASSRGSVAATSFVEFVLSAQGQAILNSWGFESPSGP